MFLEKFVRRLLALLTGVGFTLVGTGLGGFFFALGVNTNIAIAMIVVGIVFVVFAFVLDLVLDATEDGGG